MKKIAGKVQRLSQRAAELRQAAAAVPPKLMEIREAVTGAAVELQKLRADLVATVSTLRAETDAQLMDRLREVDASADALAEAGYALEGVDFDHGPARKLRVFLVRVDDIDPHQIRRVAGANSARAVTQALLNAVLKAAEIAQAAKLENLSFREVSVDIGLVPVARMGWRKEVVVDEAAAEAPEPVTSEPVTTTPVMAATTLPPPTTFAGSQAFTDGGFFARREPGAFGVSAQRPVNMDHDAATPPAKTTPQAATPSPRSPVSGDWRQGALDRFKKMPDLLKRG
jgi:hypothetical protein